AEHRTRACHVIGVQPCALPTYPFAFIESFQKRYRIPDLPQLPRFNGGLVGYFGYDTVRYVEHRVANSTPPDTVHTPDIVLMVSEDRKRVVAVGGVERVGRATAV